jgi:hypothetical protein
MNGRDRGQTDTVDRYHNGWSLRWTIRRRERRGLSDFRSQRPVIITNLLDLAVDDIHHLGANLSLLKT